MDVKHFIAAIRGLGIEHYIGVPDSTLKTFCEYLNGELNGAVKHYVPANEGAAVGLATGIYLASKKVSCVYLQNSGIGNLYNPAASLIHEKVYDIPMLFVAGWRGEPGVKDEPQHIYQGEITKTTLELLGITPFVINKEMTEGAFSDIIAAVGQILSQGKRCALIIRKGSLTGKSKYVPRNFYSFVREDAIQTLIGHIMPTDAIVSTTGKISRELYESSDRILGNHSQSFLTVGSMGHASMIALGVALERPNHTVFCLDGDGAAFMHMGAMPFIARNAPKNYIHILLNNDAHESVGGMPTGIAGFDYSRAAMACGYQEVFSVSDKEAFRGVLQSVRQRQGPIFIEVKTAIGARDDLGRPQETPVENKEKFMARLLQSEGNK